MSRSKFGILALAVVAVVATGCSSGSSKGTRSATASARGGAVDFVAKLAEYQKEPTTIAAYPPLTKTPPRDKKVYFVNAGTGSHQLIAAGITPLVSALGWSYKALTYDQANPASGASALSTAINSGADGIIVIGLPAASIQPQLSAAAAKHVPVVSLSGTDPVDTPDLDQVNNIPASADAWGHIIATAVLADAQQRGQTAHLLVISTSGVPVFPSLATADVKALTSLCSSCSGDVLNIPVSQLLSGQAPAAAVSYIQSHPKINYVISIAYPGAMRSALDGAGFQKVQVGGQASTLATNQGVKKRDFFFWLDTPNGYVGALGVDSLVRSFTGGDPSVHNREAMPAWVITKDSDIPTDRLPEFPVGYVNALKQLWRID